MKYTKKNKIYNVASIIILFAMFIIMCIYASRQSFWVDELDWTINYLAKPNILDMLKELLNIGYNLPLYYLIMFPIYKIMPYGELWLLLPNLIMVIFGVYIVKKIGDRIGGEDLGFVSLCIAVTSSVLIYDIAFELRPYALLFFLSALTLYIYICKMQSTENRKKIILYTISIILLAYTHWFGCLMVAFYFIIDVILWIRKKNKLSFIIPYLCVGVIFLPWIILMFARHVTNLGQYWGTTPSISSTKSLLKFLLSSNSICCILFEVATFIIYVRILIKRKNMNKCYKYVCLLLCNVIWALGAIYIYSKYINPKGSLWVGRYFFCILPEMFIITAIPIFELLNLNILIDNKERNLTINNIEINKSLAIVIIVPIFVLIGYNNFLIVQKNCNAYRDPYREGSEIIINTPKAYQENSALITSSGQGYLTYYFTKQGYDLPQNVFVGYNEEVLIRVVNKGEMINPVKSKIEDLLKYDTLYVFNVHANFDEKFLNAIKENYDLVESNKDIKLYVYNKKI